MDDQTDYPADENRFCRACRGGLCILTEKIRFSNLFAEDGKKVRMIDFRGKGYPDRMGSSDKQREGKAKKEDIT